MLTCKKQLNGMTIIRLAVTTVYAKRLINIQEWWAILTLL